MTRAIVLGAAFDEAARVLALERVGERGDVALVDLRDAHVLDAAAALPPDLPRVLLAAPDQELLLRAAGASAPVASSAEPAAVGPLLAAALPQPERRATRVVVVTGARGGVGRTLLVVGLAQRLASRLRVLVLDATGSGAAARRLGLEAGPWSDLEGLVDELTAEHLAVVAAESGALRVVGGASRMPSLPLLSAALGASKQIADLVLVDAPSIFDERTRAAIEVADRVLVLAVDDAPGLDGALDGDRVWLIASRVRSRQAPPGAFRALPEDAASARSAVSAPDRGALGRAYDDLAEIIALDAS